MTAALALDGLIALLLAATVGYCVVLNARLGRLRDGHEAFRSLIGELKEATQAAEKGIGDMKVLIQDTAVKLDDRVAAARALCDELALITESGNNLADRLADRLTGSDAKDGGAKAKGGPAEATAGAAPQGRSEAEKELLNMLRNVR